MPDWSNESDRVPNPGECNRGITYPSEAFNFRGLLLDWAGDDGASDNLPGALWKTKIVEKVASNEEHYYEAKGEPKNEMHWETWNRQNKVVPCVSGPF